MLIKYIIAIFRVSKNILKLKKIKEYSFIIFTSYRLYYPTPDKSSLQSTIFDHFNIKHLPKYGTAHVLHHIEDYDKESKMELLFYQGF